MVEENVPAAKAAPEGAGDTWTWTGIDADSKLVMSWMVGGRDGGYATAFVEDLTKRLANRVQLTSDGHKAYLEAVEGAFGGDVLCPACEDLRPHADASGPLQPRRMHWDQEDTH